MYILEEAVQKSTFFAGSIWSEEVLIWQFRRLQKRFFDKFAIISTVSCPLLFSSSAKLELLFTYHFRKEAKGFIYGPVIPPPLEATLTRRRWLLFWEANWRQTESPKCLACSTCTIKWMNESWRDVLPPTFNRSIIVSQRKKGVTNHYITATGFARTTPSRSAANQKYRSSRSSRNLGLANESKKPFKEPSLLLLLIETNMLHSTNDWGTTTFFSLRRSLISIYAELHANCHDESNFVFFQEFENMFLPFSWDTANMFFLFLTKKELI